MIASQDLQADARCQVAKDWPPRRPRKRRFARLGPGKFPLSLDVKVRGEIAVPGAA
jgi:hypothetical protein